MSRFVKRFSSAETRRERKVRTRHTLLAAAREQLGQGDLQIGALTRAAGVAHGTFYVHFPSKEALLDELLEEFNAGLAARLTPVLTSGGPMEELVANTADVFLDWWSEHRSFVASYAQRLAMGLAVSKLRDGINPPAVELLTAAFEQRDIPHAGLVAHGLLATWMRIGLRYLFAEDVSRQDARDVLISITLGALR